MVTRRIAPTLGGLFLLILLFAGTACNKEKPASGGPSATSGAGTGAQAGATGPSGPVITPQQLASEPGGLETVRIAYNLLLDKYYKPVRSNDLLKVAWQGVVQEVVREGGSDNGNAPKLTGDRNADFKAFSASFNSIVSRGDPAKYAFAAVGAMAQSLNDDHTYFLSQQEYQSRQKNFLASGNSPIFSARVMPGSIGYMRLALFPSSYTKLADGKTFAEDLDAALSSFESQGVKGWILDLRNDGGGHTESIATLAGRFIPSGVVEVNVDGKGQRMELPVDGHYFAHQHPLAVLINGGSGSASEITAETLKDNGVAHLIGTKTAGSVNGAEDFPLPGQVGIQYTVVEVLAGKEQKSLDRVGVQPDQAVAQSTSGGATDLQLQAAETWLAGAEGNYAPPAATPVPMTGVLPDNEIRSTLSPYGARVSDIPPLPNLRQLGDLAIDSPNIYAASASHSLQLAQTVLQRGWQGEFDQFFGSGDPYTYQLSVDLFKDAGGAQQAIHTNDFPEQFQVVSVPARLGDDTVAEKGIVSAQGETLLEWRRGRAVFTVSYLSEPGLESFDPLVQIARAVDARYQQHPLH